MKQKPKILLVIDKPNWAYDHIANMVIHELGEKYEFYKRYMILKPTSFKGWISYLYFRLKILKYQRVSYTGYDIVVYLWWKSIDLIPKIKAKFKLVGIYTEGFPPGLSTELNNLSVSEFISKYFRDADGIIAGNSNIYNFYHNYGLPIYYASCATDTNLFRFNRKKKQGSELSVCWTGNPNRNFKGFTEFLEPAVKIAQQTHPDIQLVTRFKGPIETLPEFYKGADIMINASIGDAGPCFLIDAGACGVPSISTDIGFASELINNYENGLIVNRKIVEVYENRSLLQKMSQNISIDVRRDWSQQARAKHWDKMFETVLKGL